MIMIRKRWVLACAGAVAAVGLSLAGNAAYAAATAPLDNTLYYCAPATGHWAVTKFLSGPSALGCPTGQVLHRTDAQGIPGKDGTNGTNGVLSTKTYDLGGTTSAPYGGTFATDAVEVGTGPTLAAGTYLVTVSLKAAPNAATGSVQVFPLIALYNQAKNTAFTGDLLNVGGAALESGTNANIDSYASGEALVTLTASTTLHAYADGYASDRSGGTWNAEDVSLTVVQVSP